MSATIPQSPSRSLLASVVLAWCGVVICFLLLQASAGGRWLLCSQHFDCRAVLSSKYAVAGGVPLPWWGAAYYSGLLVLLLLALAIRSPFLREKILKFALWISVAGVSFTVGLVYVQFGVLHAFCGLCMTSALIVITLAAALIRTTRENPADYGSSPGVSMAIGAFAITGFAGFYFQLPAPAEEVIAEVGPRKILRGEMERELRKQVQPLKMDIRAMEVEWLQGKIEATLLALAAAKRGVPVDQLLANDGADADARRKLLDELAGSIGVRRYLSGMLSGPQVFDLTNAQTIGPANAPVQLVVFSDYTCKYCIELDKVLRRIRSDFPQVLIAYRDFPLAENGNATAAAVAGRCAAEQGAFVAYHDRLFDENGDLPRQKLSAIADSLGLDKARFSACFEADASWKSVKASSADAVRRGVPGTPAVFVNGVMVGGMIDYAELKEKILAELQATRP